MSALTPRQELAARFLGHACTSGLCTPENANESVDAALALADALLAASTEQTTEEGDPREHLISRGAVDAMLARAGFAPDSSARNLLWQLPSEQATGAEAGAVTWVLTRMTTGQIPTPGVELSTVKGGFHSWYADQTPQGRLLMRLLGPRASCRLRVTPIAEEE